MKLIRDYIVLLTIVLISLFLSACAYQTPKKTTEIRSNIAFEETLLLLSGQADKCWSRPKRFMKDGVTIRVKKVMDGKAKISAHRYSWDIGVVDPFIVIWVFERKDRMTTVEVDEGSFHCNLLNQCGSKGFTDDVKAWLSGQKSCLTDY